VIRALGPVSDVVASTPACYVAAIVESAQYTMFLLSPANLSGERGRLVFRPAASFPLARQLRSSEGALLGDVYSFVSGLYFRGKMAYGQTFGRAPKGLSGALVISPTEGLRFLHERVTLERLRGWADVDIHERNARFTEPLIAHAGALEAAYGARTRFVLLGSVATDKYVGPLSRVFGDRLLFPSDFIGRGDMSRGAILLRAARAKRELSYVPVAESARHGERPEGVAAWAARAARKAPDGCEVVILVGLPGAGKSTFVRQRFGEHVHISKDHFRNHRRPARRQTELIREALGEARSLVVDNTNVSRDERAETIAEARRHGARVVGYYFDCEVRECVARNARREGRARIPNVGIFAAAKRLVQPAPGEGFDELYTVRTLPDHGFEVVGLPFESEPGTQKSRGR
jgi:predicted kinase